MENETFIPDDYTELSNQYKGLKKELNRVKQNLYETSRQLKVNEALLTEYQSDIELLQGKEQIQNEKFEARIASLEDTIASLRSHYSENISHLETELDKKERENGDLCTQIEMLKKRNEVDKSVNVSTNLDEMISLTNENQVLQSKLQVMEEAFENLQSQHNNLEQTLEEYKEELSQVRENLKLKREELSENATLIDKLSDEIFCANKELENYKHKPLEADSKGNSLFAEVDDRRVHLQETINYMKSNYIRLKQEHAQHIKLISQLRKENADLRESWKKDLEEIQEEKYWVNDALKRHIKVLEELLEDQKKQLEEQSIIAESDLPREYKFYQQIIDDKSKEIEQWKKKYSNKSVNEHLMSLNLAEANRKVRLLMLELKQQTEEIKDAKTYNEKTNDEVVLCHKCKTNKDNQRKSKRFEIEENGKVCTTQERIPIKSCLKQKEIVPEDDLTLVFNNEQDVKKESSYNIFNESSSCTITQRKKVQQIPINHFDDDNKKNVKASMIPDTTEDVISFKDKENIDLNNEATNAKENKGVRFSENTVDPVSNPVRRTDARIFICKKKT